MIQIPCQGLLFDLDGVLVDSTPAVARVWKQWAKEHGFDGDYVVERAHGRPSLSTIKEFLPDGDHQKENLEVERREVEDLEGVVSLPGAKELLLSLPIEHWAIVTSCTRRLAETRIKAAGLPLPKFLLTSSDVTHGKPHPEPYLKGAIMLGLTAPQCVVFEDVPAGIRSGKASGAKVIAFRTTTKDEDLSQAGADWITQGCNSLSVRNHDGLTITIA
ncbi:MAG TPA: HAD family hydrolase [Terriglobales bacterium]|nr:HAD family hydrolase [Terriglobales bacterium]